MNILLHREFTQFLQQVRDPQRRTWIIMNPTSIGDTSMVCAFARAFVKKHGYGITMIVPPEHLPITRHYPNRFVRVLSANRDYMLRIMNNFIDPTAFELDMPMCGHPYDNGDCRGDELFYLLKYPSRGGVALSDLFRHMLRLPWDAPLDRPEIPGDWQAEAEEFAAANKMVQGKSVVLFPANSSPIAQFPDRVWSSLVARLNERGYRTFCNMKGGNFWPSTMPISGSVPIEVPIHLALPLVKFAGRVISGPNGMQFLLMLGGQFEHMTVMAPVKTGLPDYEQNGRLYNVTAMMAQYMYPEMCLDLPFAEYMIPYDDSDELLSAYGFAVADQLTDHPTHQRRRGQGGGQFTVENRDWLADLVEPRKVSGQPVDAKETA